MRTAPDATINVTHIRFHPASSAEDVDVFDVGFEDLEGCR